jgi:hypothetical protein
LYGAAFLAAVALGLFMVLSGHELRQLEVRDYNIYSCDLDLNPTGPVLRVLDAVYKEDMVLMDIWCQAPDIAQHYSSIELLSVHRDDLDLRALYESRYDLILAKPELMSGSRAGKDGIGYELIAQYPDYGSQLVSLKGTPELSAAWMKGKRLGLLDDPNSVSAYQIPKAALLSSGLTGEMEIVYFRSYRQLYKALFEGQVDIIPALLSEEGPESVLQLPPGLILEATIPGPAWYMHQELIQAPVYCDLLARLEQMARHAEVSYFQKLRIIRPCHAD